MKQKIELIFSIYRQHKFYTLFMSDYNVNITSYIDEFGGGKSNQTSDQTASAAIKMADKKQKAKEFVEKVEAAVERLPDLEKRIIKLRYMCKDHDYITDYTIYETKLYISAPYYYKMRDRAFNKLITLLN